MAGCIVFMCSVCMENNGKTIVGNRRKEISNEIINSYTGI